MKVLVTGARGQLAGAIVKAYAESARVSAYSRQELDIADPDAVTARVAADRPDVIINCAAYNNVDGAEDEPEKALTATPSRSGCLRGPRRRRVRRSCTTAPTSCSTANRRARIARKTPRIRRACTRSRSCSENGLRWKRRARSCCVWRACSAGLTQKARSIASCRRLPKAARPRCLSIAPCRRATSSTSPPRRRCSSSEVSRACITASARDMRAGTRSRRRSRA